MLSAGIKSIRWILLSLAIPLLLSLVGCGTFSKFSSGQMLEERWLELDRLESTASIVLKSSSKRAPKNEKLAKAFLDEVCKQAEVALHATQCNHTLAGFLDAYYLDRSSDTLEAIRITLVGLAYEGSTCNSNQGKAYPSAIYLGAQLALTLDTKNIREGRLWSHERMKEITNANWWLPNSRSRELEESQARAFANAAVRDTLAATTVIIDLESYARRCSQHQLRETVAAELQSAAGFFSAQDPTGAVSYTLFEAFREIPPAFKSEIKAITNLHREVGVHTAARYTLRDRILEWAGDSDDSVSRLRDLIDELTDFMYEEAANSDHLADLLHRSHWAHVLYLSNSDPVALSLAQGAKAVSSNQLKATKLKNLCTAKSFLLISQTMRLVDDQANLENFREQVEALLKKARTVRESSVECERPASYVTCSSISPGSREYFRTATRSLVAAIEVSVQALEANIGTMSAADVQTRRNIIAAQIIAALKLHLRSVDEKSACFH